MSLGYTFQTSSHKMYHIASECGRRLTRVIMQEKKPVDKQLNLVNQGTFSATPSLPLTPISNENIPQPSPPSLLTGNRQHYTPAFLLSDVRRSCFLLVEYRQKMSPRAKWLESCLSINHVTAKLSLLLKPVKIKWGLFRHCSYEWRQSMWVDVRYFPMSQCPIPLCKQ